MPDREKVIKGLECCIITPDYCRDDCPYIGKGDENDYCDEKLFKDAIALLKAQEPIEARLHLCESCTKEFPECEATVDDIEFGCGVGNDNIIGCLAYVNRWKAQEPVAPVLQSGGNYVCGACGVYTVGFMHPLTGESVQTWKYCGKCGKKVRWE